MIPPTDTNLEIYEKWALSGRQQDAFFGDLVEDCFRIQLVAGDTFMIPTGKFDWISSIKRPVSLTRLIYTGSFHA